MTNYSYTATAAFGLEGIVSRELKELHMENVLCENGKVSFTGDKYAGAAANLYLRCADRVFLTLKSFPATSFEELFQGVKSIPFGDFMPKDASFPVSRVKSRNSKLYSLRDIQSISKKAAVESMKKTYGINLFAESGASFPIEVEIEKDIVTVKLDMSGTGLHRRGFRPVSGEAPLRETLAATMLKLANYHGDIPLHDPMCGTGTILMEASMLARNVAPGLYRSFACEKWPMYEKNDWIQYRREAREKILRGKKPIILGSDIDKRAISITQKHLAMAGIDRDIVLQLADIRDLTPTNDYRLYIMNPPYGERMLDKEGAQQLSSDIGKTLSKCSNAKIGIITGLEDFQKFYGKKSYMNRKLYNGKLKCYYYLFNN